MITLISYDDHSVAFPKAAALLCPYIKDAFASERDLDFDQTLPTPFANGAQLTLLKQIYEVVHCEESKFLPTIGKIIIGGRLLQGQPFYNYVWDPALQTFLTSLNEDQIIDLLYVADDMCAWPLRNGLLHFLLYRHLKYDWKFKRFFTSFRAKLAEIAFHIYDSTTAAHSGYCGRPRNIDLD